MTASHGRRYASDGISRVNISRKQAKANCKKAWAAYQRQGKVLRGLLDGLQTPQEFDIELAAIDGVELWDDLPMHRTGDDQ